LIVLLLKAVTNTTGYTKVLDKTNILITVVINNYTIVININSIYMKNTKTIVTLDAPIKHVITIDFY